MARSAWLSQTLLPRLRRHAPLLLAGAFVVFLAGGASMAHFARKAPRPVPQPAAAAPVPEAAPAAAAAELAESDRPLDRLAASVASDPARLFPHDDPLTVVADGVVTGIELRNVRPRGLYASLGLHDGDRVGAINGVPLGSSEVGAELLRAIAQSRAIELSVERGDGTRTEVSVPRERLLEELGVRE